MKIKAMKVRVMKLNTDALIPNYAKQGDAGMDLTAVSKNVQPQYIEYGTGLSIEIPEGFMGLIFPRSSVSKMDLVQANSVGIIDAGYRGEILVRFKSTRGFSMKQFNVGDRIAQLVIIPFPQIELEESMELSNTDRGTGGFGHTGN
jgi:dUTP pyrophosphatase